MGNQCGKRSNGGAGHVAAHLPMEEYLAVKEHVSLDMVPNNHQMEGPMGFAQSRMCLGQNGPDGNGITKRKRR